jgi:hypothetical protein
VVLRSSIPGLFQLAFWSPALSRYIFGAADLPSLTLSLLSSLLFEHIALDLQYDNLS